MRRGSRGFAILLLFVGGCSANTPLPPFTVAQDADFDGQFDADDACPHQAEDGLAPRPFDGCPNRDPDADGLAGALDRCPFEPENMNHFRDDDGCPDEPFVSDAQGRRLALGEGLRFTADSARLTEESRAQLAEIAELLLQEPSLLPVDVAVYEAAGRGAWLALGLSAKRAFAIRRALVEQGIPETQIVAQGYGDYCFETHPAGSPDSPRVDIVPTQTDLTDAASPSGCEAARQSGTLAGAASSQAPVPSASNQQE